MKDKRVEVLRLLEQGKITTREALEMLDSLALYNEMKVYKGSLKRQKKTTGTYLELQ